MGLRKSLRLPGSSRNKKQQQQQQQEQQCQSVDAAASVPVSKNEKKRRSQKKGKSKINISGGSSSAAAVDEETSRTQSLSAPLQTSSGIAAASKAHGKRRNRFSFISSGRKRKQSTTNNGQSALKDGALETLDSAAIDAAQKTSNNNANTTTSANSSNASRKRSGGGLKILRRLSSPMILQHHSSLDRDSRGSSKDTTSDESHGLSTSDSDEQNGNLLNPLSTNNIGNLRMTVVPESYSPLRKQRASRPPPDSPIVEEEPVDEENEDAGNTNSSNTETALANTQQPQHKFECATAILQHSYLERICGGGARLASFEDLEDTLNDRNNKKFSMSEDPTVQESIECIVASQLEQGLELWDDAGDEDELDSQEREQISKRRSDLVSPADLQQSRMNRKDRKSATSSVTSGMNNQTRKRYEQASLVYVGTYDPNVDHDEVMKNMVTADDGHIIEPMPCECHRTHVPPLNPKDWPQAPILLRPTPGSSTRVKSIRFCGSDEPLWVPGSHQTWWQRLETHWGRECKEQAHFACCEHCAVCPVNNGNEAKGESLVIDFDSDLFEGTLLLRLRFIEGTTPEPYDDSKGYFKGVNRRYQTVVRGRFKKAMPFTHMVNGFRNDRRFGKLPAKWILRGGMKVISFFAPQLDAKLDGAHPYSLTPLGSTAQSMAVDDPDTIPTSVEDGLSEPTEDHRCLIGQASDAPTSLQRAKLRKKVFDKHFVNKSKDIMSDPSKVYTMEFLQHLFNFETFSIELGNMLGSVELEEILDGQPLQIMAAFEDQPLWSFDVWHECLWNQATANED
ncbi:MAG: hypothetical protein SGILL_002709 [Bacillariaceae sp.]